MFILGLLLLISFLVTQISAAGSAVSGSSSKAIRTLRELKQVHDNRPSTGSVHKSKPYSFGDKFYQDLFKGFIKDKRVDPSANDNIFIIMEALNGHHETVAKLLKDKRVDPSACNNLAIRSAAENGHHETVARLLKDKRVDPSDFYNFPIRLAAKNGHHETVATLLKDERVDPRAFNNEAIRLAAKNGHHETVATLLKDERVDPSAFNNQAIRLAAENGHLETVELLLKRKEIAPLFDHEAIISQAKSQKLLNLNKHQNQVEVNAQKTPDVFYQELLQDIKRVIRNDDIAIILEDLLVSWKTQNEQLQKTNRQTQKINQQSQKRSLNKWKNIAERLIDPLVFSSFIFTTTVVYVSVLIILMKDFEVTERFLKSDSSNRLFSVFRNIGVSSILPF